MASFNDQSNQYVMGNAANGPLSDLYTNEYDFQNMYYPRNLGSETRGHYINFYINVADVTSLKQNTDGSDYTFAKNSQGENITGRTGINSAQTALGSSIAAPVVTRKTKRITKAIALYMPDTVNVQYNTSWQADSLTEAMGNLGLAADVTKTIGSAFASKSLSSLSPYIAQGLAALGENATWNNKSIGLLGNGAKDFALFTQGYALNPRLEVLFKGTDMRQFQFDFLFSPFSSSESQNVQEIIKVFKYHQAPEINTNDYGRLFVPPSEFDIDFLKDGQINDKIHQIGTCVLTNVNVDYAPFGWSTFEDGYPTNIRMTLQFMETEIVTKQRVLEDNY